MLKCGNEVGSLKGGLHYYRMDITIEASAGAYLVWTKKEVSCLRDDWRIAGNFVCSDPEITFGTDAGTLPLQLMPEQVSVCLSAGCARLVRLKTPSHCDENAYNSYIEDQISEQSRLETEYAIALRLPMARRIAIGRKKKELKSQGLPTDSIALTPEEIDATELDIRQTSKREVKKEDLVAETWLRNPFMDPETCYEEVEMDAPSTREETIRFKIFKDLWDKGHFLTGGIKFGADYLVYPGDPTRYHSAMLAVCLLSEQEFTAREIGSWTRVANQVKKTVLLCTLSESYLPVYVKVEWHKIV